MRLICCIVAISVGAMLLYPVAGAAQHRHPTQPAGQPKERTLHIMEGLGSEHHKHLMNANTVTVVSGNADGTDLYLAMDMAAMLDGGKELRLIPMVGKGAYQNIMDVLHLKGVDLGITHSNIMSYLKQTGEFGPGIDKRIVYVTMLHSEEMHILAGPGIKSVHDLNGRIVNFGGVGSGTQFCTRLILDLLGIRVREVNVDQVSGYQMVKSGRAAATALIAGKPAASFRNFALEPGMTVLSVPYTQALEQDYYPAKLTHDDYPNIVPPGGVVDTVAVASVLVTFNWLPESDRYRRVARFVDAFFSRFPEFQGPGRHPKWREVNLHARVRGWSRFPAAEEWLAKNPTRAVTVDISEARAQAAKAAPGDPDQQEQLLREFLEWIKTRGARERRR